MIEELEKLLKEATPTPWIADSFVALGYTCKDASLVCLLRNNAEKLLAVVKAATDLGLKDSFTRRGNLARSIADLEEKL